MTPTAPDLRAIAHNSLSLTEAPYLKHYRRGRFKSWRGVGFTASSLPGPGFCFAAVLVPNAPTLDELLPVAREFFADCEQGWGVLVEADTGHPMEDELIARGWPINEDEPAYVMPEIRLNEETGGSRPPLAIRIVRTPADEATYHRVVCDGFQPPPELANSMLPVVPYLGDPQIALLIGSINGQDVSVAGFSVSGRTAVVWGVATLEPFRSRGYGAAVTRAALAEAAARGCTSASLRSGPKSRPLYERLGFRYVCNHRTYGPPPA
jgi:GNAT superfamily N-acetyltransferase